MTIETWDRQSLREQERVIGRTKAEGAPLSGGSEFSQPDFALTGRDDEPLIATDAHVAPGAPDAQRRRPDAAPRLQLRRRQQQPRPARRRAVLPRLRRRPADPLHPDADQDRRRRRHERVPAAHRLGPVRRPARASRRASTSARRCSPDAWRSSCSHPLRRRCSCLPPRAHGRKSVSARLVVQTRAAPSLPDARRRLLPAFSEGYGRRIVVTRSVTDGWRGLDPKPKRTGGSTGASRPRSRSRQVPWARGDPAQVVGAVVLGTPAAGRAPGLDAFHDQPGDRIDHGQPARRGRHGPGQQAQQPCPDRPGRRRSAVSVRPGADTVQ